MIAGIGFVNGVRSIVWVDDSGIKAGAMGAKGLEAGLSVQKLALRHKLPFIHLVESAGADLTNYKVEMWASGGTAFANLARMSAAGIPTIAVLHGASTAGGAYMPGLSDYVIGVKKNGMAALAGAALVYAATGEVADDKELGSAEMHATVSGLVEYLADDDVQAVAMARDVVDRLNWNKSQSVPPRRAFEPPLYDASELAGIVPADPRVPYDVREVAARLVDGSDIEDFKPNFGASTVCMRGSIHGIACGLIGNNGPIDPDGANKATQFFQLCDQADIPVIFLNNTTGFMVGTAYEQAGMIKHGSKMIQAVTNMRVPKITLYIGSSFGAGNYGMSGYGFEPDFLFAWPNSKSGVMGGEQAAKTMSVVQTMTAKRKGIKVPEQVLKQQSAMIQHIFDGQSDSFVTSGRVLDHGIIDPRDSRKVLGFCLETVEEGRNRRLKPNAFGVGRM
jgi:geranyl-CoA carboxylase beta subunit